MVWYLPACPSNVPTRSTLPLAPVVVDEPDDDPHADSIPAPITQAPSRTAARRLRPGSRRALRPILELRPRPSAIALPLPPYAHLAPGSGSARRLRDGSRDAVRVRV